MQLIQLNFKNNGDQIIKTKPTLKTRSYDDDNYKTTTKENGIDTTNLQISTKGYLNRKGVPTPDDSPLHIRSSGRTPSPLRHRSILVSVNEEWSDLSRSPTPTLMGDGVIFRRKPTRGRI